MTARQVWEQLLGRALPEPASSGNANVDVLCFCHDDNKESLSIELNEGLWYCHATGTGGTLVDAVRIIRQVSNGEARAYLKQFGLSSSPNGHGGRRRAPRKDPPPLDGRVVDGYVRDLEANPDRRAFAAETFGWEPETMRRFAIGFHTPTERYTIPIRDEEGLVRNIRFYSPSSRGESKVISWKKGYGRARLFPIDSLRAQTVLITEGEKDCILLNQEIRRFAPDADWAAITATGGAATWDEEWSQLFFDKDVVVVYDIDDRGETGARKVAASVARHARSVKVVTLDINDPPDGDVTDYFVTAGNGWDEFTALLDATETFDPADDYPDLDSGFWAPDPEPDPNYKSGVEAEATPASPVQPDASCTLSKTR